MLDAFIADVEANNRGVMLLDGYHIKSQRFVCVCVCVFSCPKVVLVLFQNTMWTQLDQTGARSLSILTR